MTELRRRHLLLLTVLAGCATPAVVPAPSLPSLRLPPSALGAQRWALSQRLSVMRLDAPAARPQQVELQLQLDASGLLLAGFALGQRVLLMQWDGEDLTVQRHPRLPPEVDTDRMLRDLCLVYWPAEAVRAALPAGWSWEADAGGQALSLEGQPRLRVRRPAAHVVEIDNLAEGYGLVIESQPMELN